MIPFKCDALESVLHGMNCCLLISCVTSLVQCFSFLFHCFAVEPITKLTLSHFILKIQVLDLAKAFSSLWLEREVLCQSLSVL